MLQGDDIKFYARMIVRRFPLTTIIKTEAETEGPIHPVGSFLPVVNLTGVGKGPVERQLNHA